jgi:hypothetical protein
VEKGGLDWTSYCGMDRGVGLGERLLKNACRPAKRCGTGQKGEGVVLCIAGCCCFSSPYLRFGRCMTWSSGWVGDGVSDLLLLDMTP